jgi:glycogen(starch) synthase
MDHDLLEQATAVSSVSKYTAIKTSDYLQYKGNIKVIYNGLDTHIPVANVKKVKNRVIFTGSLLQKKGIYQLIKAWNIVHEENKESELWIFGKGPIDELKALVSPAAVKSVYFKGHVGREMLFEELCRAGIAVFPSFAESFGLAPLEAMICGCAVIFTQSSCGPEIVQDGVTGLLADPYNINDIASKILLLLNNNTYCGQLALRGQRYVKETFDIKKIAKDNQNYYSALLQ